MLLAAAGCGSPPEPGSAAGGAGGLPIGRAFDAIEASQSGRDRPLVAKAAIEFLADGRTLVATGCNSGQGRASLSDGKLVADDFAVTQMGCLDPAVADQETFVMSVVGAKPVMVLEGDLLVLRTDAAEIRFLDRKVADPDRPLEGTRWRVDGVFDSQMARSIAGPKGELVLSGGRVRFTGPCSDLEGPAAIAGTTVTFGSLTSGRTRSCDQDQQRAQADMARVLSGQVQATVKAGTLRFEGSGGDGLTLVAAG
jgi:heat shock protein HslJ